MDMKKISDVEWEIPAEDGMNVPGVVLHLVLGLRGFVDV